MSVIDLARSSSGVFLPTHHACLLPFIAFSQIEVKLYLKNEVMFSCGKCTFDGSKNDVRLQKVSKPGVDEK